MKCIRAYSLYLAWLIAIVALFATLYSSEVLNYQVCHLCWYQRICIYPLAILLGIAAYQEDRGILKYALPLTIIALLLGLYQYLEQMVPGFQPIELCGLGPSCSDVHFKWLGFITFPFLGMLASAAMAVLLLIYKPK